VILDLQAQAATLQTKLETAAETQAVILAQRKADMDALSLQMKESAEKQQAALKEKDDNMAALDAKSKEAAAKLNDLLKEKNVTINDLGKQLELASKKAAGLYKKIEKLEAKNLACENKLNEVQSNLDKARHDAARLSQTLEADKKEPATAE